MKPEKNNPELNKLDESGKPIFSAYKKTLASNRKTVSDISFQAEASMYFWWKQQISHIWNDEEVQYYEVLENNCVVVGILLFHPLWELQMLVTEPHLMDVILMKIYFKKLEFQEQ